MARGIAGPADVGSWEFAMKLVDSSIDGISAFDRACRYTFWSRAMEQITGLPREKVLGRPAFEVFPFLEDVGEDELFFRALAGERASSEGRPFLVPETGRRGVFDAYYAPLWSERGEILGGTAVVRDVTERKAAEEAIRETEGRFGIMADAAPVMLWMARTDGMCTFFNQTWLHFTGRTLEQEWGVGWAEGVHPEDVQPCMDGFFRAFSERQPFELEYRLRRRDGEYRWVLDRGTPRFLPDGAFGGYIGSTIDDTERKRMEVDLRNSVRARDEFLQIASHELKTPLTPLRLQLDTMARGLGKAVVQDERLLARLDAATRQTARLSRLVESLLAVSRIAAGLFTLHLEEFDFCEMVRRIALQFRSEARKAGSDVAVQAEVEAMGRWDRHRCEQVVSNLLSNAIKFGAGRPVELEVRESEGLVRFAATDHGIGIEQEALARIFGPFERAVSPRHYGGLGLGLFVARHIAEAHGGTIVARSRPGSGSTFTVLLPREPCARPDVGAGFGLDVRAGSGGAHPLITASPDDSAATRPCRGRSGTDGPGARW
jgi:PAS domain S-box-containing protein